MSLNLDDRQRAMLDAMGVKFWWPKPVAAAPPAPDIAIKKIADIAMPTNIKPIGGASGQRDSLPRPRAGEGGGEGAEVRFFPSPQPSPHRGEGAEPHSSHFESHPTIFPTHDLGVADQSWAQLQSSVSACQACGLCQTRKNTVFGVGQPSTQPNAAPQIDWMIVGEAPGENEDAQGEPFVGQAGKLLDNMLRAIGLARHDKVFIANVLKCRPPGNRNPTPAEVAQCAPYLLRQIELLQPKIILAMGRFAISSLLAPTVANVDTIPVGKLRGQVHRFDHAAGSIPVVVTYHPAYLLRNLPEKAKAWADLCLAHQVVNQVR